MRICQPASLAAYTYTRARQLYGTMSFQWQGGQTQALTEVKATAVCDFCNRARTPDCGHDRGAAVVAKGTSPSVRRLLGLRGRTVKSFVRLLTVRAEGERYNARTPTRTVACGGEEVGENKEWGNIVVDSKTNAKRK